MDAGQGDGGAASASDAELMRALAAGDDAALQPLYARYAPAVFGVAVRALDRAGAEDVVQDVFFSLWRNAGQYDAERGPLKPWLLQIARFGILNELRRRSRRPRAASDPDGDALADLADPSADPGDAMWGEFRRRALSEAIEALPATQRQALSLAFLEELTHEQVADILRLRLGTTKTRIRAGLRRLREHLTPVLTGLVLVVGSSLALLLHHLGEERSALARDERALDLVTSSDVVPLRLEAVPGAPVGAHATYRSRPGTPLAVLSASNLPPAPTGQVYQAWLRQRGIWLSLGTLRPGADGKARIVVSDPAVATRAEALEVTLESAPGAAAPSGRRVIAWPAP